MTTLSWRNVPVPTMVQTWVGSDRVVQVDEQVPCSVCGRWIGFTTDGKVCLHCLLTPAAELAPPYWFVERVVPPMHDEADYAEVCADRDRYIARCAELERRLEAVREVVK